MQANCFRQKHTFLQILLKEKKHKQVEGMLFHLFDSTQSSPTPPPKKKPNYNNNKKTPLMFLPYQTEIQQRVSLSIYKQSKWTKDTQSWSAIRKLANQYQLGNAFFPLNFCNCSYEIYANHWKESQHLAPWMLTIIKIPMNCNQEFTV